MAINIIKEPSPLFTMECERCECVFTYTLHDLTDYGRTFVVMVDHITCPCCGLTISHSDRKRN